MRPEKMNKKQAGKRRKFSAEYKAEVVRLCQQPGATAFAVANELGLTPSAVMNWVKQATVDANGGGADNDRARRASRASSRSAYAAARARDIEAGHRFFRQGGHVMTADVTRLADETSSSIAAVCRALSLPRSSVYAQRSRAISKRARDSAQLDVEIATVHAQSERRYGSPRVHRELRRRGRAVGRNRIEARMRLLGLHGRRPKRFRRTTEANPSHVPAPNLLDRRFNWQAPNQAWAGDITFIWTQQGWVYLAILVDLCTRAIVGWSVGLHCDAELALRCLDVAVARHKPPPGLLHHTDRGSTYTAAAYRKRVAELGMIESMSRKGNCWDNAVAESTFGTIKTELLDDEVVLEDIHAVQHALFPYIESFYNRRRLHSALDYITPSEKEQLATYVRQVA
jgi:putative transposase